MKTNRGEPRAYLVRPVPISAVDSGRHRDPLEGGDPELRADIPQAPALLPQLLRLCACRAPSAVGGYRLFPGD